MDGTKKVIFTSKTLRGNKKDMIEAYCGVLRVLKHTIDPDIGTLVRRKKNKVKASTSVRYEFNIFIPVGRWP